MEAVTASEAPVRVELQRAAAARAGGVEWGGSKRAPKEKDEMTIKFLQVVRSSLR